MTDELGTDRPVRFLVIGATGQLVVAGPAGKEPVAAWEQDRKHIIFGVIVGATSFGINPDSMHGNPVHLHRIAVSR